MARRRFVHCGRLLLDTRATVAVIALDVGYDREAAFTHAFKRQVGNPPGRPGSALPIGRLRWTGLTRNLDGPDRRADCNALTAPMARSGV